MNEKWIIAIIVSLSLIYAHVLFPVLIHQCARQIAYAWAMGKDEATKEMEESNTESTESQCGFDG